MEWNDNWRDELKRNDIECFKRLENCKNKKHDILVIARLIYKYNYKNFSREECLDRAIEWITGWNNQVELIPTNYEWYLKQIN